MAMDTYDGWPLDGALTDNAEPKAAEAIIAGMMIKKDATSKMIKATGAANERAYFALEDQSDFAVVGAKKMAFITKNAVMLTDQFDTGGTYTPGTRLMVDSGNAGKLKVYGGGAEPVIGHADGLKTRDEISYLKVVLEI